MSYYTSYETLQVDLIEDDTLLEIVLSRPKGNVLNSTMMNELDAVLAASEERQELRCVLLRGDGGLFSYGAAIEEHTKDRVSDMLANFHRVLRQVARYPVPIAALIEGPCLGGGFELVLACHFLFAKEGAKMGCPEIKLACFPPVLAALGSHRLGSLIAERMLLTGETIDAATADRLGFLTRYFKNGNGVESRDGFLEWYRKTLRPLSAMALRQGTRSLRGATGWLEIFDRALAAAEKQYVDDLLPHHDAEEGINAFIEKRPPEWTHA